jgi:multicomponent K+:H+ antiporter subunit E
MKRFSRWLPRPGLALALWITWLTLNQTLAPAHLLLGAVLAIVLARFVPVPAPAPAEPLASTTDPADDTLVPRAQGLRRLRIALGLIAVVLQDIVVANLQVARLILGPQDRLRPGFVPLALRVRDPQSITLLASIITMTPGTLSAELSDDRRHLLVHTLDLADPAELAAEIRTRYETPLLELLG